MSAYHSVNEKQPDPSNSEPANRRSPSPVSSADTGPARSDVGMSEKAAGGTPPHNKPPTSATSPVGAIGSGSCTWREFRECSIKERIEKAQDEIRQAADEGYFDALTGGAPEINAIDEMSPHWAFEVGTLVLRVEGDDGEEYRFRIVANGQTMPGAIADLDPSAWCSLTCVTPVGAYLPGLYDWAEVGEGDLGRLIEEAEYLAGQPQALRERAKQQVTPIVLDDLDIPFYTETDAEIATDRINAAEERVERIKASCKAAIDAAKADAASVRRRFEWHLERYAERNTSKGRRSIHLTTGEIGFRAQKKDRVKVADNAIAVKWALEKAPHAVKKVETRKVVAAEMQSHYDEYGEVPPGCEVSPAGDRFFVRAPKKGGAS